MAEPPKLDFQIPAKFQLGNGDYLVFDEAEGISFDGANVLYEGKVVGTITKQDKPIRGFIHTEATIDDQKAWEKFMDVLKRDTRSLSCGLRTDGD